MTLVLPADRHAAAQILPGISRIVLGILDEVTMPGEQILGVETARGMRVLVENWTEEDRFLDINTRWYPGTKIDTVSFTKGFEEFQLRYSAVEATETEAFFELSGRDAATAARIDRARYASFAATFVRRSEEVERAELLTTSANWGAGNFTDNGGTEWGEVAGDILADVDSKLIVLRKNVGVTPGQVALYMSPEVWDKAKSDAGFVAYRKSGGKSERGGFGTLEEMSEYLKVRTWTDATGIQVVKTRGGTREPVWGKHAILYTDWSIIPSSAEWGVPRLGFVQRNKGPGAATPYFVPQDGRVWHFPWLARERSFLVRPTAGHLFLDTAL